MSSHKFDSIPEIIQDVRQGKMVILVDDEDRENEGDIIIAADHINPQAINFMASHAKGLICLSLTGPRIEKLGLPLMVKEEHNKSANKTAFTVSIEAATGVSTGISAADRAHTIRVAANPNATPADISVPGHIFPIKAQEGGVLKRAGHTEASVDLVSLAGLNSAAVICEIMNEDGTMARVSQLMDFAKKHGLKIGTIEELIEYRLEHDTFVEEMTKADFPNPYAEDIKVHVFKNKLDGREHLAFVKGVINPNESTPIRVQTECVLGDVFCGELTESQSHLTTALRYIDLVGKGIVVYLRMEDMDNRLIERVKAYEKYSETSCRDEATKTFHADKKDYGVGAQILRALGAGKLNLLSNSQSKRVGLKGYGLEVVESTSLIEVQTQLKAAKTKMNHQQEESTWQM